MCKLYGRASATIPYTIHCTYEGVQNRGPNVCTSCIALVGVVAQNSPGALPISLTWFPASDETQPSLPRSISVVILAIVANREYVYRIHVPVP